MAGRLLSAKPDLPGASLVRQEPPPTHSGEEAPPEATEQNPSSKTPPPPQRPTSAPEAWAPPPAHSHWPSSPRLPRSTGPGGTGSTGLVHFRPVRLEQMFTQCLEDRGPS
ncbi:unnamed protein product [Gulo gulo]|uniref:Uncharacterized protein n=1 Tax=Gulo gulo TaxID=48420 RepID=A0A9X9Q1K2_GULGU|nr:unnamed protein product [Gulo gulo]